MLKSNKVIKLLDVKVDNIKKVDISSLFSNYLKDDKFNLVATINPEFLVNANRDKEFKKLLNNTAISICDGVGISFFSKLLFKTKLHRTTGVEVADILCKTCEKENKSIYFLGGFGVAEKTAEIVLKKYPNIKIAGYEDGNPNKISKKIIIAQPDAILVAFGSPKQEFWLANSADKIPSLKIGIGIGGTFDFWTGKIKRAPKFTQTIGLEWLWRFCLEPIKRGRRIFKSVFVFSFSVIISLFKK